MPLLTADRLIAACADDSFESGISIRAILEPLGGPGQPVKPAIYAGANNQDPPTYQHDMRWHSNGDGAPRKVAAVVIDNVPSQANRLEAALAQFREALGLPELVLDLSSLSHLPSHLPRQISSFLFPHRNGDAYLRDAQLDGTPFLKTATGQALFAGSSDDPAALFEWMPQALLLGFWQSHLGKKRQQTKLARSWVSEIVGIDPATLETTTKGVKGDPLNLSTDEAVAYDDEDLLDWTAEDSKKVGKARSKDSLAEIGHGQVLVGAGLAGVSFAEIVQQATVSFAGLRRIQCGSADANAAGRAVLVALGLAAHVAAFGRAFSLRSGCDLRPVEQRWTWRGPASDEPIEPLSFADATELLATCAAAGERAGLPVGGRWPAPLVLQPQPKLASVITKAWPVLDQVDA